MTIKPKSYKTWKDKETGERFEGKLWTAKEAFIDNLVFFALVIGIAVQV